ncbi:UNVERIFIED_CONTAM: Putrescine hydroxycinnamoyltransferase [Sesamum latifolium]|uniref:Putrescine hydroxycinnamoyltransferase n=1 Tax=Sesamum latifolium TaxID=2727402 RepID=A0AAW2Y4D8_9LAMI
MDGRYRLNPKVPKEYFGNLVLWAFARAKVNDLLCEPLSYATKLLHDAVMKVDDSYFRSFIDFANNKVKEEDLIPNAVPDTEEPILLPNLEVHSWLSLSCHDFDFGGGGPHFFMPTFFPIEEMIFLLPSSTEDGSIDVFVPLFREKLTTFK